MDPLPVVGQEGQLAVASADVASTEAVGGVVQTTAAVEGLPSLGECTDWVETAEGLSPLDLNCYCPYHRG